jgi:hypothetical protein
LSMWTRAEVSTDRGSWPARCRSPANAIEKQPACAAPISSSGLVPEPSSKRDWNEYGPSKAPEPSLTVGSDSTPA